MFMWVYCLYVYESYNILFIGKRQYIFLNNKIEKTCKYKDEDIDIIGLR